MSGRPVGQPISYGTGVCSVVGCGRDVNARELCKRHYYRWSRYGDPLAVPPPREPRPRRTPTPCSIEGCETPVYGRGWCEAHYARWRRHGSTDDVRAQSQDPRQRFEARVDRTTTPDGCHLWTGPPNGAGYGYFKLDGRSLGVHVVACLFAGVDVPAGYEPDHLCLVKLCVRLEHLEVVTEVENKRRGSNVRWKAQ